MIDPTLLTLSRIQDKVGRPDQLRSKPNEVRVKRLTNHRSIQ